MAALYEAALAVTGALDLATVLQRVVDQSRGVLRARYGAVAVLSHQGAIEHFVTSGLDAETVRLLGPAPTGHGLLGVVLRDQVPLRTADIERHPESVGFPPHHPRMKRLLAVPLTYEGQPVGSLYVADRADGRAFSAQDELVLSLFGAQAAIAVANARLHDDVQRLSLLEERERIGMDLHDGVMQALYAAGLGLEAVLQDLDGDRQAARAGIERTIDRLGAAIADIRHYIFDLRVSPGPEASGLAARLREMIDTLAVDGVDVVLTVEPVPTVPKRVEWECWHITREAVANAVRHSGSRRLEVAVRSADGQLRIAVSDQGRGFDPTERVGQTHRGLANMRRRAETMGATLSVDSAPGAGTRVTLSVPLAAREGDGP